MFIKHSGIQWDLAVEKAEEQLEEENFSTDDRDWDDRVVERAEFIIEDAIGDC